MLILDSVASAVNELTITNAAAGGGVTLVATGGDAAVALSIDAKGTSVINIGNTSTGDILIGGGSASTGCTLTNSTGAFACTAGLSGTTLGLTGAITGATGFNGLVVTPNTGVVTTGIWNGTLISSTFGGTGTATNFTQGSMVFTGASGVYTQDNSNLFFNDTTNNLGLGTATPLARLDVAGNIRSTGKATAVLTGSIDPAASAAVLGVGTLFTTELIVGDRILVTGETRTVIAIADNTNLTVDTAFSNNANDTSPDALYALFTARLSSGAAGLAVNDLGYIGVGTSAPKNKVDIVDSGAAQLRLTQSAGSVFGEVYVDASGDLLLSATGSAGIQNVRINQGNLWACAGGSCGATSPVTNGNVIVENAVILDNNFQMKQTSSSTVDMLDSGGNIMLQFDEGV